MKVLSLFDGISCAQQALKELGVKNLEYFASEIDKYAISITQKNHPDTIQLGDVCKINGNNGYLNGETINLDLLIGGSPCQNLSIAGNGMGLDGDESKLFFEFIRIRDEVKPKYFILENVGSMSPENRNKISNIIGVEPIMIDAKLVSAQDRKRLFWVGELTGVANIQYPYSFESKPVYKKVDVSLPENKNIFLRDIITGLGVDITERMNKKVKGTLAYKKTWGNIRTLDQKSKTLTVGGQSICNSGATNIKYDDGSYHSPSPIECERLQSLPDNYTAKGVIDRGVMGNVNVLEEVDISNTQRYKALGNAFNVEVVKHILKHII